jgi:hypothetical protein
VTNSWSLNFPRLTSCMLHGPRKYLDLAGEKVSSTFNASRPRRDFAPTDKWNIASDHAENAVAGWGGYQKPKKSKVQIDLERRRELGMKYPSNTSELIAIAAKCRSKPKKCPPAPHPDDIAPSVTGPCQLQVASMKARRAGTAVRDHEPCVDQRQAKLEASRARHRARYKAKKAKLATRLIC